MLLRLNMLTGLHACVGIIIYPRNAFKRSILSKLNLNHIKTGRCSSGKSSLSHFANPYVISYGTVDKESPVLYSNRLGNIRRLIKCGAFLCYSS